MLIVDLPRADRCNPSEWECTIQAALAAMARSGANVAMVATLPELMPEDVAVTLMAGGVVPMYGLSERSPRGSRRWLGRPVLPSEPLLLAPAAGATPDAAAAAAEKLGFPVVLRGEGFAHKTRRWRWMP